MKFRLDCPNCGKVRHFTTKYSAQHAKNISSSCFSCRTARCNKTRNVAKDKNPAWKGYKTIPGKVISRARRGAFSRGLSFDISIEDVYNQYTKQHGCCALSGVSLEWDADASIDRIDSSLGYTKENIQIVHKILNMMKRDLANEDFISWCTKVQRHREQS